MVDPKIESLLTVAKYGNFTRAAEVLSLTQPAVSHHIKQLETELDGNVKAVYSVYADGKLLGYGVQVTPIGFKEAIGLIVGTTAEGECLGVEITSISDTPGVGTKVKEKSFLEGFIGLDNSTVEGFDTISGATISSKAVKDGVSEVLALDIYGKTE